VNPGESWVDRHFGSYRVQSLLGAGGMGEVYRALDTKLGRDVAIKVLPPVFSADPERRARFEREARLLAALSHPNIGTIYGLEEAGTVRGLVLEFVDGPTLADRIAAGPLTIGEALDIARQIAEALEAAHERGIVHRDLKPANVKITPGGLVKVLDFGLAKVSGGDASSPDLSRLVTSVGNQTSDGVLLGTAPYMSPEQARGMPTDKRTDIWAFGCVLYEMLTANHPFRGPTMSDTIASVLSRDPQWQLVPQGVASSVHRLLQRCLEKDSKHRLRDIGDARLEIEEALKHPFPSASERSATESRFSRPSLRYAAALLAIGGTVGAIATAILSGRLHEDRSPAAPVGHFVVSTPTNQRLAGLDFPAVAIAPDGSAVVYVASRGGRAQLFLRSMNRIEPTPMPGTSDASSPFFSPDGRWVGFFATGKLQKVSIDGGAPLIICDAAVGLGGSWGSRDVIVFAPTTGSGLFQVPVAGGRPTRVTALDVQKGEFSHRWPELLPDGRTVLFTVGTLGSWDDAQIVAQSLESGRRQVLVQGGTNPHYVSTGHLVYAHAGVLMALRFDPTQLKITGAPVRVLDGVMESADGAAQLGLSANGTVVYVPNRPESAERQLVSVDRTGAGAPLAAPPRAYSTPRLSPDGRKLVVTIAGATDDLWLYDIPRGTLQQLTFEGDNGSPSWTPDGERVTYTSNKGGGTPNLFWIKLDGSSAAEKLAPSDYLQLTSSWSSDRKFLAYVESRPATGRDVWMLPMTGDRTPHAFLDNPYEESAPRFSPDGRWIAYVSNESGRNEVYLVASSNSSQRQQVSRDGGSEPVWVPSGRELVFRSGDQMMIATIAAGRETGTPRVLFQGFEPGSIDVANYDVTSDGGRFVMVQAIEPQTQKQDLQVLLNWIPISAQPSTAR